MLDILKEILDALRSSRSPWLRAEDAARYAHVREERMYQLLKSGEIPSYKVGRSSLTHTDDIDRWIRNQQPYATFPGLRG